MADKILKGTITLVFKTSNRSNAKTKDENI